MRFGKLAALGAMIAGLFRGGPPEPKKVRRESPLLDFPSRGHIGTRAMRKLRRKIVKRRFQWFLARRPIGEAAVGTRGMAWRKGMAMWLERWAAARQGVYRNPRKATIKASALHRWNERRAS